MAEPPPRTPPDPPEDETVVVPAAEPPLDETVVVPAAEPPLDETVVVDAWEPETAVFVEAEPEVVVEETEVPPRRPPLVWPWLLAFLVAVLAGLGAYYFLTQEDEKTVPAVIGLRQEPAEASVRDAGLDPQATRQDSSRPRGVVLEQDPEPGAKVDEGSDVRLVVSNGPARETVPEVVGETEAAATSALTDSGFKADVTKAFSDKKAGTVVSQEPKGGTNLKEGSTVALTISQGSKPVTVPDVVGTTSSEATATLRDAGLQVNVVAVPSDEPSGTVIAQSPAAGQEAKSGAAVRLNVAQAAAETTTAPAATTAAPEPATVPEAVGKELAVAAQEFAAQGLKVAVQYVPSNEAAGRVVAQAQPAGTKRKRGDTVQVNVSIGAEPAAATGVPDVVGRRQDQGRRTLEQAGFEVLALSVSGSEVRNESPVASQTPGGGASIPRGSLVILYVG